METACFSKWSLITDKTTCCHNPEDPNLNIDCCEDFVCCDPYTFSHGIETGWNECAFYITPVHVHQELVIVMVVYLNKQFAFSKYCF